MYVMKYMENIQEMQEGIFFQVWQSSHATIVPVCVSPWLTSSSSFFQFNSQTDRMRLAVELFVSTENTVRNTVVMGVPGLEHIQFT